MLLADYVADKFVSSDMIYNPLAFDWVQDNDTTGGSALNLLGVFSEARENSSTRIHFYNSLEEQTPTTWKVDTTGYSIGAIGMTAKVNVRIVGVQISPRGRTLLMG